jgi:ribA/ribD-fused uncharacterized protein
MNEHLAAESKVYNVTFVDNDLNFRFLNEIPDEKLLLADGLHLSALGVERLLQNLKLTDCAKSNLKSQHNSPSGGNDHQKKRLCTKSKHGVTLFFGKESVFSNLHTETPICIDGKKYTCNEQYYTYSMARFFNDHSIAKQAMSTKDPYQLIALQKKVECHDYQSWLPEAERILYLANMAKYTQNEAAREVLLNTRNDLLGEATYSKTWGIGASIHDPNSTDSRTWSGKNIMGKILMNIRTALCDREHSYEHYDPAAKPSRSCWFCGEQNHISRNCRHGQKVQCNSCFAHGHKAKFCGTV